MMNCQEATRQLELHKEGRLKWKQRWELKFHLWLCGYCARFEQHSQHIQRLIERNKLPTNPLSIQQKDRIKKKLKNLNS
jgi:hypothetical protein